MLIVALAFLSVLLLVMGAARALMAKRWHIQLRLQRLKTVSVTPGPMRTMAEPFAERFLRPLFRGTVQRLGRFAPRQMSELAEQRLVQAGNPWPVSGNEFIGAQIVLAIGFGVVAIVLTRLSRGPGSMAVLLDLVFFVLGGYLPHFALSARINGRRTAILEALPDALDLLVICVEAGLGLDAALQRVVEKTPGPLASEFQQALSETRLGKPRQQALQDLAERVAVPDLSSFVHAILQADRLGVPIADVLRTQSDYMRDVKRQRVEENAMKAPIKMLFPMVFFILPVLLLMILGPAAIQAFHVLSVTHL